MAQTENHQRVFLLRHGQTEWSKSGQHTGRTDIPLTPEGEANARKLAPVLAKEHFALVLCSPLKRAARTCELAGLGGQCEQDPDLVEWDYGNYEGLKTPDIRQRDPGWTIFTHPTPGGETAAQVGARLDRVIARVRAPGIAPGDVALFGHGHALRVLGARWLGLPPQDGRHFMLGTATVCVLSYEHNAPAVLRWNAPIDGVM